MPKFIQSSFKCVLAETTQLGKQFHLFFNHPIGKAKYA